MPWHKQSTHLEDDSDPFNWSHPGIHMLKSFRVMALSVVLMYLMMTGTIIYVLYTANQNHETLCTFRDDIERRAEAGEKFLEDNPNGIPGIPRATLQSSIENRKRTVKSLEGLRC